ncbi:transposase [Halorubrum sp. CSM-61]|uniref:transposase n=1 Tax=Halorubrum sp. CSM-61 TaxID=2485838 RepID=UPI000F4B41EC|nr:transposase [Halorubrum sp. CSM-61]
MYSTRSDTNENTATSHKTAVREFLRTHGEVASKEQLRAGTEVPAWYIDQIASQAPFYTSLNHHGSYVASKHVVGHRSTHDGFWRPKVDDGIAVFHRKESTKATLKHLAFNRPSGLTAAEANDRLERPCYRALAALADDQEVHASEINETTVYTHRWPSRRDAQLSQRETDQPSAVSPPEPADDGFLYRDELLATFLSVAVSDIQSIPPERAAALVLRQFEGDSFEALERRIRRNYSLREALDYTKPEDVPDGTSLWRAFDELQPEELRDCLQSMCSEVLAEHDHAGEFIVIDGTHIAAWANTREEIEDGDVEGASWGYHEGKFYGYKVFLVVDAASELPVAITMETGSRHDSKAFTPLIEEFDDRYDFEDIQAVLADAGFDSQANRDQSQQRLSSPLLTVINPRRSKPLKAIKKEIKRLFKKHGDEIDSPYDALERLPQKQLSEYGVEVGSVEETYIFQAIKERMHRHLRAGVERVFSRLKSFTGLDRVRARKENNVETHVVLSAVALVAASLTAKRQDKPGLIRSPSRLI